MSEKAIDQICNWALNEVGYHETGTNINKYASDMWNNYKDFFNGNKQGIAWCAVFVCDDFCQNFGEEKALKMLYLPKKNSAAGCPYAVNYYKAAGKFYSSAKRGDQIFFGSNGKATHTGIVISVSGTTITTVEGNKNDSVKKCVYKAGDSSIIGYGRPDYSLIPDVKPTPSYDYEIPTRYLHYVENNIMTGEDVKSVQAIVGAKQDGKYGIKTKEAVANWQAAHGLVSDGKWGEKSWMCAIGAK